MDEKKTTNFKSILCGAATGAANGLFGGGGGMIAVPLLRAQGLNEKKGARHGDCGDFARFSFIFYLVRAERVFRFFGGAARGARRVCRRVRGSKAFIVSARKGGVLCVRRVAGGGGSVADFFLGAFV